MCPSPTVAGLSADLADDLFDVSITIKALRLQNFCGSVKSCFDSVYLREPTLLDIVKIEKELSKAGFSGCLGCLDCTG